MLQRCRISMTFVLTCSLLVSLLFVANGAVQAQNSIIVVNTSTILGNDGCDTGECTLLEALALANSRPGIDTIHFNIPGEGPHTIQPFERLVMTEVIVDGYSQPGAHPSTSSNPNQMDAKLVIEIDGSMLPQGVASRGGLVTNGSTVKGLILNRFPFYAFRSNGGLIQGNFIGTDASGSTALPNGGGFEALAGVRIEGNVIAGNSGAAATVFGDNVVFVGNRIGLGLHNEVLPNGMGISKVPTGDHVTKVEGNIIANHPGMPFSLNGLPQVVGNTIFNNKQSGGLFGVSYQFEGNIIRKSGSDGVVLSLNKDSVIRNNTITESAGHGISFLTGGQIGGGKVSVSGNTITANGGAGISLPSGGPVEIQGMNAIYNNGGLGIDLGMVGVTPNDWFDGDTGANLLQNFPEIAKAGYTNGVTTILAYLHSTHHTGFTFDFFANKSCDPSGFGEGERYLGSTQMGTGSSGDTSVFFTTTEARIGDFVTATVTDMNGNTSEFSACFAVTDASKATITIRKETQPDSMQDFGYYGPFGKFLLDDAVPDDGDSVSASMTFIMNPGTYRFAEVVYQSWHLANIWCTGDSYSIIDMPNRSVSIPVKGGDHMTCTFVTQRRVNLQAIKFNDLNADGVRQANEPALAPWEFRFYKSDGSLINHKVTDANGSAVQNNVIPDSFKVCETPKTGWTNTLPGQVDPQLGVPCYNLTVPPGQNASLLFGNTQAPVVRPAEDFDPLSGVTMGELPDINEPEMELSQQIFLPMVSR